MKATRVALVQYGWLGSVEQMKAQVQTLVASAAKDRAQVVCLPELSLTPYFPSNRDPNGFMFAEPLPGGAAERFFAKVAHENEVMLIGSLFERTPDGQLYDTATLHTPTGELFGITRKVHIPSGDGYHETDYFQGAGEYPVHQTDTLNIAAPTCYDQWFPELARIYALNGAEFIFYPTAIGSEPTDPKIDTANAWQTVMRGHAIANGVFIAAANRIGHENGVTFYGSSFICDPMGQILAQAGRDTTEVIIADLDPYTFTHWRELFPLLRQRRPAVYARIVENH